MKKRTQQGFTLVELLVAMALAMVIMAAIFKTFKSQQDSYIIQDQVVAMQQNLRGAMYVLTKDLQLAGYGANFDRNTRTLNWDDRGTTEAVRPLIYAGDNVSGTGILNGTDTLTIVKANRDFLRELTAGETATAGTGSSAVISLANRCLDSGNTTPDLDDSTKKYGLLIKSDLRAADFFEVNSASGDINPPGGLTNNYTVGDIIARADILVYRVNDSGNLVRKNLGNDLGYQTIAENIDNLQFSYVLNSGSETNDPNTNPGLVRAVRVFMLGRTAHTHRGYTDSDTYTMANASVSPGDGFRRKLMCATVKTRNIGLTE